MSAIFGERLSLAQEQGPDIDLIVFGDEFYARYETPGGYTVVFDPDKGLYCYAALSDAGALASTGVPATSAPPAGLAPHLKEGVDARRTRFGDRYDKRGYGRPAEGRGTTRTFGPQKGLLEGRTVSHGAVRGLVVLVQFQDVKSTVTAADVDALFNQEGFRGHGNACSVRDYFRTMSNGKLDFSCDVVGPITLSHERSYYAQNLLVEEAMDAAVKTGIDLTRYDSKGEKILDAVTFLYAGPTQYKDELWPHNSEVTLYYGPMETRYYMLTSMGKSASQLTIGTICHELGHMLCRFADLYDYGDQDGDHEESEGIGVYCLMGSGNHLNSGHTPAPICAYWRDLARWCDPIDIRAPGDYVVRHGDYGHVLRYRTDKENEYFLVENRARIGFDEHLPAAGLAVYHCDILGSNEHAKGSPKKHYQCALLQADGQLHLEHNCDRGSAGDLYGETPGVALSDATNPSSKLWSGVGSGLMISRITKPGEVMSFRIGGLTA